MPSDNSLFPRKVVAVALASLPAKSAGALFGCPNIHFCYYLEYCFPTVLNCLKQSPFFCRNKAIIDFLNINSVFAAVAYRP